MGVALTLVRVADTNPLRDIRNKQTYPTVQTVIDNTITRKHTLKLVLLLLGNGQYNQVS